MILLILNTLAPNLVQKKYVKKRPLRAAPGAMRAARRTPRRRSSDAGKPLVYVPKLRSGSKYSGQLRFPQQEVALLPGTPWKI